MRPQDETSPEGDRETFQRTLERAATANDTSRTRNQPPTRRYEVFTRSSSDLADQLDAHANEQVTQAVAQGWEPGNAAAAWRDYVQVVAEAAADGAVAEGSWGAS